MNRKGFTLVELLAVLFIILLLGSLVFVSINEKGEKFKEISYEKFEETIVIAAKNYVSEDDQIINKLKRGDTITITVNELANLKYLNNKSLKNPKTYRTINPTKSKVTVKYSNYNYEYVVTIVDTETKEE